MRILDTYKKPAERILPLFREAGRCNRCQRWFAVRQPHHIIRRGIGGGSTLDVPENLLSLCAFCHGDIHAGKVSINEEWRIVSEREGVPAAEMRAWLHSVLATAKEKDCPQKPWERKADNADVLRNRS